MEEISFMVCVRVDDLDGPVEGSTTTACVECGHDIWISAASRKEMHRVKGMPLCAHCAKKMAQEYPVQNRAIGEPSEEQFEEIVQELREHPDFNPEWGRALDGEDMDAWDALRVTATMSGELLTGPDDDWGSVAVFEDWNGRCMPPIPLSNMMEAGIPKEMIARQLLPALAHAGLAKRLLLGLSTWTIDGKRIPDLEGPISEHPDRTEALVLMEITADGVQRMSMAEIKRDGISGPTLGEWKDTDQPDRSDGLFVDAVVPALQLVRTLREKS